MTNLIFKYIINLVFSFFFVVKFVSMKDITFSFIILHSSLIWTTSVVSNWTFLFCFFCFCCEFLTSNGGALTSLKNYNKYLLMMWNSYSFIHTCLSIYILLLEHRLGISFFSSKFATVKKTFWNFNKIKQKSPIEATWTKNNNTKLFDNEIV